MKKFVVVFILLLFIPSFYSLHEPINVSEYNNILYVGGSGPNNYTKIQDAIDDAKDGYIIYVYPGYYNESIVINKSISLIGIGDKPVIDGDNREEYTVLITANNCKLRGFDILNGKGVEVINSFGCVIENNSILYSNGLGIFLYNSSYPVVKNNEIKKGKNNGIHIKKNIIYSNFK